MLVAKVVNFIAGEFLVVVDNGDRVQSQFGRADNCGKHTPAGEPRAVYQHVPQAVTTAVQIPDQYKTKLLFGDHQQRNEDDRQHDYPARVKLR